MQTNACPLFELIHKDIIRGIHHQYQDNFKEWTGMDFASSTRAAENRSRWKGIVANSSVVPRRPPKVMG